MMDHDGWGMTNGEWQRKDVYRISWDFHWFLGLVRLVKTKRSSNAKKTNISNKTSSNEILSESIRDNLPSFPIIPYHSQIFRVFLVLFRVQPGVHAFPQGLGIQRLRQVQVLHLHPQVVMPALGADDLLLLRWLRGRGVVDAGKPWRFCLGDR